jgi:hypothetical protein
MEMRRAAVLFVRVSQRAAAARLDDAILPAHLQRCARFEGSFAPDFTRNYEAPGGIHVGNHGTNNTILAHVSTFLEWYHLGVNLIQMIPVAGYGSR